jgi:hypothetical protein
MSNLGIQALMLIGIHSALTHHEVMGLIEVARVLGNSYRQASSGPGSSVLYGRFAFNFCRTVAAGVSL